jgi:cytosine/adenosine deaminase-related metal-dependent hydrolase
MSEDGADPGPAASAFESAYAAGVSEAEDLPRPLLESPAIDGVDMGIVAAAGFALRGCVLTPDDVLDPGHVVVDETGRISAVQGGAPSGVEVVDTDGIVLPGLIDLHGHPDFNIFAAWEPPKLFINRMQWRNSELYHVLLRDRWDELDAAGLSDVAARYAEVRALVGGTTAIQGTSPRFPTEEALVRNVDKRIFGEQIGRSMVDLDERSLGGILEQIEAGDVTAFYVHVAEGRKDNEASHNEFAKLVELGGLTEATVLIHATALDRDELKLVKEAGAKLVWSPQSNLRLYGETTSIADATDLEIPVALGADWLPSGSRSLLDEMRVARHEAASQGAPITDRELVRMVTRGAASISGLAGDLGLLGPGRPADVLVLERHAEDPWESVLAADPSWLELVTIAGDLAYGRSEWIERLGAPEPVARCERVIAWGKPMLLDTSYAVLPHDPPPRLATLRDQLISGFPNLGPIFA